MSKVEDIVERRAQLSPAKRALLERFKRGESAPAKDASFIARRATYSPVPASFTQQRLWFLDRLMPDLAAYNIPTAVRLEGALDIATLRRALDEIARRHESLRTAFGMVGEQPMQLIAAPAAVSLPVIDLRLLAEASKQTEAQRLISEEIHRPFNLSSAPLWRVALLRLAEQEFNLLITMHHIISDGWSSGIFIRELSTLYSAFLAGKRSPLPELPIQYADFALWQRERLQAEALEKQLSYWRQHLSGCSTVLELPTDRQRPAVQTFRGATEPFALSRRLTESLKELSRAEGVTLFMLLLAAFETLIYRHSGQRDFLIGSPIAGRPNVETEGVIGFFVNTLVLRADLSGNPSFRELLRRVRETTLEAYAHQDIPFEKLVEELQPARDTSRNPLFQVMFALQNMPESSVEVPGLKLGYAQARSETAKFDLWLSMYEGMGSLAGVLEYKTDLFYRRTIERLLERFEVLLGDVAAHPERRLSELEILSAAERRQLLREWNETKRSYEEAACLHQLFERQAAQTPQAVAVSFEDKQLTYAELSRRANQLAHYLQRMGVGADVPVGLCAERSMEMVVALLAILKAGAAYLPLDPSYPKERLSFMLEDARIRVLLAQEHLSARLPEPKAASVVVLDADWHLIEAMPATAPLSSTHPENLAYVIYTSGTTGHPKGVMIPHRGISNRLFWMQDAYGLSASDRVLQKTSFSFDVSVWEFFWPLLFGAQLVLAKPEGHKDTAYLLNLIKEKEVTVLHFVPSMLRVFLQEEGLGACSSLKHIISSGEALSYSLQEQLLSRLEGVSLHNLYGPTEASVDVTAWTCQRGSALAEVPIGFPVANTDIYLLDSYLEPVPAGVPGELYIGGVQLGRGYLNRPELTAEKFIPHPFSEQQGARLYKTGDLASYLPDGSIKFIGRVDEQVKIRGFRIEPQEIEAVLGKHPAVMENAVVAWEDWTGRKRLVAYVVPNLAPVGAQQNSSLTDEPASKTTYVFKLESELREYLKDKLPDYMIPSAFVVVVSLPLMPNGKIDRKRLPAPERVQPELEDGFKGAQTPVEKKLVHIWSEVLGLEHVGVHNNFFELGGDSISVIQVVIKANQAGLNLSPIQLFQHQTIAELATVAVPSAGLNEEPGAKSVLPLIPIQHVFFESEPKLSNQDSRSVIFEVPQGLDISMLKEILEQLFRHHDALRLRFEPGEEGWRQVYTDRMAPASLLCADLSAVDEAQRDELARSAARALSADSDFSAGELVRAVFFESGGDDSSLLLLCLHRLVADSESWRILREDFNTACAQLMKGETIHLPPRTISFNQWSQRLLEHAQSPLLQQQSDYWLSQRPAALQESQDEFNRGRTASFGSVMRSLGRDETHTLLQEIPGVYRTRLDDILLAALGSMIPLLTEGRKLFVEIESRERDGVLPGVNALRTVGCFAYRFPLFIETGSGLRSPGETIKLVKEQLRKIPDRGVGYGLLRYLNDEREVARQLKMLPRPAVTFISNGESGCESEGLMRLRQQSSDNRLSVDASLVEERLEITWTYDERYYAGAVVERLADNFNEALRAFIAHCQSPGAGGRTPSDFPLANLEQAELDRVLRDAPQAEDIYPLAPMQEHMLTLLRFAPEPGLFVIHQTFTLQGLRLDADAFERAWQQVVARYPVLRTSFVWDGLREPLQIVHKQVAVPFDHQDWSRLSTAEQDERVEAYVRELRRQGFDLSRAPQTRLALWKMGPDDYRFLWAFNFMLQEGWSFPIILKDFFAYYEAFSRGQELSLEEPKNYRDYIAWVRRQDLKRAETYWKKALEGFTGPTPLVERVPGNRPQAREGYVNQVMAVSLATSTALRSLARRNRVTLYTFIQGAWALLLSRFTGHEDVIFGSMSSGRPTELPGVEKMVGSLINLLPVRVGVSPDTSLLPWIQDLQAQQVEMRTYEYTPPVKIKKWNGLRETEALFESYIVYENYPIDEAVLEKDASWNIGAIGGITQTEHPLRIMLYPIPAIMAHFCYYRRSFDDDTIARIISDFQVMLAAMVEKPNSTLGELMSLIQLA